MPKRFIEPDWKALRKLSNDLQRAFFYCWDKADACGVYEHDVDYMKADLKVELSIEDLKKLPNVKLLTGGKVFFLDFIQVNYGTLKEGYNPHKPVFRALAKNKISSLNQAYMKLEEEGEDEDEKKEEDFGKSENLLNGTALIPEMLKVLKAAVPTYPESVEKDFKPLSSIAKFISQQGGLTGPVHKNRVQILEVWRATCAVIAADNFYRNKSLSTISNHIQEIVQIGINGKTNFGNNQPGYTGKSDTAMDRWGSKIR
jgi:hypothetical protein